MTAQIEKEKKTNNYVLLGRFAKSLFSLKKNMEVLLRFVNLHLDKPQDFGRMSFEQMRPK